LTLHRLIAAGVAEAVNPASIVCTRSAEALRSLVALVIVCV
jgi:hypothetical protein